MTHIEALEKAIEIVEMSGDPIPITRSYETIKEVLAELKDRLADARLDKKENN